jgi:hypothetical protein
MVTKRIEIEREADGRWGVRRGQAVVGAVFATKGSFYRAYHIPAGMSAGPFFSFRRAVRFAADFAGRPEPRIAEPTA